MLFYNARIYTAAGSEIEDGFILVRDGKIIDVGPSDFLPKEEDAVDLRGATVYPGFVDAHSHIGMWGDGKGQDADDGNEDTDPATPQLRAVDAVNPADRAFREALEAGVTTVVTGPGSANAVAGQMLALKTYGATIEDRILRCPLAMKFALGENPINTYRQRGETPATRMATAAVIREQLMKARRYAEDMRASEEDDEVDPPDFDMKAESLQQVLDGTIQAHFHAHRQDDIFTAVRIAEEFHLNAVIIHGTEGWLAPEQLAAKHIPVIAGPMIGTRTKPELANMDDCNPAELVEAGIPVAICTDHPEVPERFLALSAGIAVRGGMSREDALRAITIVPAEICGIAERVGSIEPGKDADFVVFDDDPFSVYTEPVMVVAGGTVVGE